jgi:hypothetical protein
MTVDRTPAYRTLTVTPSRVVLQAFCRVLTRWESQLAVIASTPVIALLLNPLRRHTHWVIDRLGHKRNLERRSRT